jgi:hypothetical protein
MSETMTADPAVDELDLVTVADKPREPTEFEKKLRRENASYRVKIREAEAARDAETARITQIEVEATQRVDAARATAASEANQRIIRAEMKAAALAAGMVDMDGLKLLDTSVVTMSEAGDVVVPADFFEKAKVAKPYLFGAAAVTTSTPAAPPPTNPPAPKHARDMDAAELRALGKTLGLRN